MCVNTQLQHKLNHKPHYSESHALVDQQIQSRGGEDDAETSDR